MNFWNRSRPIARAAASGSGICAVRLNWKLRKRRDAFQQHVHIAGETPLIGRHPVEARLQQLVDLAHSAAAEMLAQRAGDDGGF